MTATMQADEVKVLKELYAENDYPSDRLRGDPGALGAFAAEFNARVRADYSPREVGDELIRQRKRGALPRLGRRYAGPKFALNGRRREDAA